MMTMPSTESKATEAKIERGNSSMKIDGKNVIKIWESMQGWYWYAVEDQGEYTGVGADGNDVQAHAWFGYVQADFNEWGTFDSKELERAGVWTVPKSNWGWTGRMEESKASEDWKDDGDKYNRDLDEIRDKAYDYVENNLSKFNLTEKDVDDWHNGNGFNGRYENTVNRVIDDMTYRLEKPLYESKASEGQFDPNIDDLWYTSDTTMRSKILSKSGITGGLSLATTEWDDLPLDIVIQLEEINVAALNESLASEDDPDYDNDADFEGKINGASVEPSQYTQSGMDHTDYGRGDIDESKSNEAGSEDHMCAECGFITSDNSEYIDHLNSHEE